MYDSSPEKEEGKSWKSSVPHIFNRVRIGRNKERERDKQSFFSFSFLSSRKDPYSFLSFKKKKVKQSVLAYSLRCNSISFLENEVPQKKKKNL